MGPIQESNFAVHSRNFMKWFDGYLIKGIKGEKIERMIWFLSFFLSNIAFLFIFQEKSQ